MIDPDLASIVTSLVVVGLTWLAAHIAKTEGDKGVWAVRIRAWLPLVAPFVGAALQSGIAAATGGQVWWKALIAGAMSGFAAVWFHEAKKTVTQQQSGQKNEE